MMHAMLRESALHHARFAADSFIRLGEGHEPA
jgi:hypothetical protein